MDHFKLPIITIPNIVFFPHTNLPITVAEPTYIKLIEECIDDGGFLGISLAESIFQPTFHLTTQPNLVCGYGQPLILEELPNGIKKILIKGVGRAKLLNVEQNLPYAIYNVSAYKDHNQEHKTFDDKVERLKKILDKWINMSIRDSLERDHFVKSLTSIHHIVDYLCMFLIKDAEMRQLLLENGSLSERIQLLNTLLRGDDPVCEDIGIVTAIKSYERLENLEKLTAH